MGAMNGVLGISLEHINYYPWYDQFTFSRGFSNVGFESLLVEQYGGYALNALWWMAQTA